MPRSISALMTPETAILDSHARRFFDETYICTMRDDHPDAKHPSLSLDRFCALDHALVSYSGERFRGVTDDALAKLGRQRNIALTVTGFLVLASILKTTDLMAVAPRRLVEKAPGLVIRDPPVETPPTAGREHSCSRPADASTTHGSRPLSEKKRSGRVTLCPAAP